MIQLLSGDCREVLRTLPDASVHMVCTSPPYYGQRSYGVGAENGEMGSEATPDAYLQAMVEVFREVRRVMRPDATLWINIGDAFTNKQLQMMPARLALALQADGFYLRADIIWAKPNPMPESVTDRPTSAHEHIFLLSRSARYYYDSEAIREPLADKTFTTFGTKHRPQGNDASGNVKSDNWGSSLEVRKPKLNAAGEIAGANSRNVWTIATEAFPSAHFATFPTALAERCIRAGTSERGCCAACGKPWVRQTSVSYTNAGNGNNNMKRKGGGDYEAAMSARPYEVRKLKDVETLGWSPSCKCDAEVAPCTVLDCFSGAGTTALVADRLGRNAIGIDLSHAYVEMARERLVADCPLFAELSPSPPADDAYDRDMADLFAPPAAD